MSQVGRITVKDFMVRYNISERTAVRWRRSLRAARVLVGVSPKSHSVVGDWRQIDEAVLLGTVVSDTQLHAPRRAAESAGSGCDEPCWPGCGQAIGSGPERRLFTCCCPMPCSSSGLAGIGSYDGVGVCSSGPELYGLR